MAKKLKGDFIYKGRKLPDSLKSNNKAISVWKKWVRMQEQLENHPKRYMQIPLGETGELVQMDLAAPWSVISDKLGIEGSVKTAKFPESLKDWEEEIMENWMTIRKLINSKNSLRYQWAKDEDMEKSRDIFDVKGTQLIKMFGSFMSIEEVQRACQSEFNFKPAKSKLREFFYAKQPEIERERKRNSNNYDHLPLTNLTGRVEQLAYLYETNKKKYIETGYNISRSKELRAILEQVKVEIEGNRIMLDVNGKIDVDLTISANESLKKVSSMIPLLSFIVGIVASKAGIDAMGIMNLLQTSIYSKYSGVMGILPNGEQQDLSILPSNQVYDWMTLKDKVYGQNKPAQKIDIEDVDMEEVKSEKEKLLQLIKEKKSAIQ